MALSAMNYLLNNIINTLDNTDQEIKKKNTREGNTLNLIQTFLSDSMNRDSSQISDHHTEFLELNVMPQILKQMST